MVLKDRNAYKNVLRGGLTSLLNPVKNKANSAGKPPAGAGTDAVGTRAGPAMAAVGSAGPAAAAVAASLQNAPLATAKHHASEGQTVKSKASSLLAMLVKDVTAYRNLLLLRLTSLLDPAENKASSAAWLS